jgi:ribulose-phosphate 3-epimerase
VSEKQYQILPSILSADLTRLGEEVQAVILAGADRIHFDVMDNHYVPNLTFGPAICAALHQRFTQVNLDVHLMVTPVDALINAFAEAGANRISIHPDASLHVDRSLKLIKELGCETGLVLNPATTIDCLQWCHPLLDFVLVMTVNPGFGGQKLIPNVIEKIVQIHNHYPNLPICVDGGVDSGNIGKLAQAGATQFVAGSAIFSSLDYTKTIASMRHQLSLITKTP